MMRHTQARRIVGGAGWLVLSALLWLGSANVAMAQTAQKTAEKLFDEGHAAYDAGRFEEACRKFAKSNELDPAGGTLMSLADCEERVGSLLNARTHYHAALSIFGPKDERVAFINNRLTELDAKIPRLRIVLDSDAPADTTVELDGYPVLANELQTSLPLETGSHRVQVRAPGRVPHVYEPVLKLRERRELVVAPGEVDRGDGAAPKPVPVGPSPRCGERTPDYTAGWVVGGISAAIGLAAVALTVRAFTHFDRLSETCARRPGGCSDGARNRVANEALASNVLYGVAGAGALATLLLFAVAPDEELGDGDVSVVPQGDTVMLRLRF